MNPRGSPCWRKRWIHASAGSVKRVHPASLRFGEAERDVPVFERFQEVVGQGNPVDGGGEVGENLRASAGRFAVDHPCLFPDVGRNGVAEAYGSQCRLELATEELREYTDGHAPGLRAG
jgi:hypothetical protein